MKISILIPTCERPKLFSECINSCLVQSLMPDEIIVGDDSKSDSTFNAIESIDWPPNVTLLYNRNSPGLGQAANVNNLFNLANGDKVLLIHDDDMLLPNTLETLAGCFEAEPSIDVAFGKQYIMTDNGEVSLSRSRFYNKSFYRSKEYEGLNKLTSLEAGMSQQFPNNAFLIRTELARELRYRNIKDACDFDFGLRLGLTGAKMYFKDHYVAKYRISDVSVSKSQTNDSALYAFREIEKLPVPAKSLGIKLKWLKDRAGVAVGQSISTENYEAASQLFYSKYHLPKIFTIGGIKRFIRLCILGMRAGKTANQKVGY
ncbi:glycosyltransferase family 2 protein [Flavitalea sp.]|nr:glycosyltransferase family 2 protein [Flavitalea sp.]